MRVSHVCAGCAKDLARVRASRDDATGWPVAVCPSCGKVSPRPERHAINDLAARRLSARPLDARATWLTVAAAAATVLLLGWIAYTGIEMRLDLFTSLSLGAVKQIGGDDINLLILSGLLGGVLALAMGHWKQKRLAVALFCGIVAFPLMRWLVWTAASGVGRSIEVDMTRWQRPLPWTQVFWAIPAWIAAIVLALVLRSTLLGVARNAKHQRRWTRRAIKKRQPWRSVHER